MQRPDFITNEDIIRWDLELEKDTSIPRELINEPVIREACYAGMWLHEELQKLGCPFEWIIRIQYSAGKAAFGNEAWKVHQDYLEGYKNDRLDFVMGSGPTN